MGVFLSQANPFIIFLMIGTKIWFEMVIRKKLPRCNVR